MSKSYLLSELAMILRLRLTHKPEEISQLTGRTEGAINQILHKEKKKRNLQYPKLKHGNVKHDMKKASHWRTMIRTGLSYRDIQRIEGVFPSEISRVFAREIRGELSW